MFLRNITQAYIQLENPIIRLIFIEPPPSLNLGPDQIVRVIKPLYGLPESVLFWFETYRREHTNSMSMNSAVHDMCFLFRPQLLCGEA